MDALDERPTLRTPDAEPVDDASPTVRAVSPYHPGLSHVALNATTLDDAGHVARYKVRDRLGEGGMGEVHLCRDRRVGRDVAMKVIRADQREREEVRARFLREARVQGQLEHPSIVPVYDLGIGDGGASYFTMKRVRGVALDTVINALAAGDEDLRARFTRHKLLTAFTTICNAVDYAHHRGVIHRDLKPENVMLGDFGEVYVLDWGVARLLDAPDDLAPGEAVRVDQDPARRTVAGALIGTPGYMAPEQVHGEPATPRSDVYALGAILFELLVLETLHPRQSTEQIIASTIAGPELRAEVRAPGRDVPPELEAAWMRATALDPAERFADARALCAAVERFLEGDRDTARRRAMAREHAVRADALAELALASDAETARRDAIQEAGRALALDPREAGALGTLLRLLIAPPRALPAEVRARVEDDERAQIVVAAGAGSLGYLAWAAFIPVCFLVGVNDPFRAVMSAALFAVVGALSWYTSRQREFPKWQVPALALMSTFAVTSLSSFFGPFVLVPAALVANTMVYALAPDRARGQALVAIVCAALVILVVAPYTGLFPSSYSFEEGAVRILPRTIAFDPLWTPVLLLVTHVALLALAARIFVRLGASLRASTERTHLLTWQLQQIVPDEARQVGAPSAPPPAACLLTG